MINTVRKMWTDERGQDIAEYAVIMKADTVVQSTIFRWLPLSREAVRSLRSVRRLRHGPLRVGDLAGVSKRISSRCGESLAGFTEELP